MFEHDVDSDDDFEGYFLQPVKGYNIVDKIREANEELLSLPHPPSPSIVTGLQRKVKFRDVLEEYEPEEDYLFIDDKIESIYEENCEHFDGAEDTVIINSENTDIVQDSHKKTDNNLSERVDEILNGGAMSDGSDTEIDEICEEIASLEIENNKNEIDNSEISNYPLNSRENDDREFPIKQCIEKTSSLNSPNSDDNDDDNEISIIVSSYDTETLCASSNFKEKNKIRKNKSVSSRLKSFPIGSKVNEKSSHNISDMLKLRLSYKTCCEYKNALEEYLPRYNGFYSQYGLSKEQWDKRERFIEKGRTKFSEHCRKQNNDEAKKDEDNEKAFTNWLKNKIRFPVNKTKNMFDFKPSRLKRTKTIHN